MAETLENEVEIYDGIGEEADYEFDNEGVADEEEDLGEEFEEEPPVEYGIDFDTGQLTGGKVTGAEAVKVWAWLALHTVRYRFEIFTWNYGCEIEELIGTIRPLEYIETEAKRMVEECLLVNPYILAVEDFDVILLQDIMVCGFTIVTEFGEVELNVAF